MVEVDGIYGSTPLAAVHIPVQEERGVIMKARGKRSHNERGEGRGVIMKARGKRSHNESKRKEES